MVLKDNAEVVVEESMPYVPLATILVQTLQVLLFCQAVVMPVQVKLPEEPNAFVSENAKIPTVAFVVPIVTRPGDRM